MSEPEQKCEICYSIVDGQHSPSCCYHADTCQESTLRASNAALKAENEALEKDGRGLRSRTYGELPDSILPIIVGHEWDNMSVSDQRDWAIAKLSRYTSWRPSDPGTKEAMEWAARNKDNPLACDHKPMLDALATALTAAMVRLEEAEKA